MVEKMPDYFKCTREELLDVLQQIDGDSYPERVTEVHRVLSDPEWLQVDKNGDKGSDSNKSFLINAKLIIPFVVFVISAKLLGFIYTVIPSIQIIETYEAHLKWGIPLLFVFFLYINAGLNYLEGKRLAAKLE